MPGKLFSPEHDLKFYILLAKIVHNLVTKREEQRMSVSRKAFIVGIDREILPEKKMSKKSI